MWERNQLGIEGPNNTRVSNFPNQVENPTSTDGKHKLQTRNDKKHRHTHTRTSGQQRERVEIKKTSFKLQEKNR